MQQTSPLKFLFVINPISGGIEKRDHENAIKQHFESQPHSIHYFLMDGKDDAHRLSEEIEKLKPNKVIAVGGDGTVTMVARQVVGTNIEMGIIPAGSANGMARELNIPMDIIQALEIIKENEVKKVDLININNLLCLHLSDIGLNARLIKYFEQGNLRGKLGYAKVALKALWRRQNMELTVQTKGNEIRREAMMVVLANASKYGTGAVINPHGNLFDGLFEVVIIRKLPLKELIKIWFRHRPFDPENIEVLQAEAVTIETLHKVHFQVDGEYIGKVKKVQAYILHGKLNLILPRETPVQN